MDATPLIAALAARQHSATTTSDAFAIGVADGYGFLVEVREGEVHLHPAVYEGSSGPFPRIDLQAHCSMLDERMKAIAQRLLMA